MKRIVTLTVNPTIDIAANAEEIRPIRKTRTHGERLHPGGGGINVARVVQELGGDAMAFYLSGGAIGPVLESLVEAKGIQHRRLPVGGETRISFTVHEEISGREYRFVPEGPEVTEAEWRAAIAAIEACDADYVVASGSLARTMPVDFYAQVGAAAQRKGARFVLDTSGPALEAAIRAGGVFLAKPSLGEFEALTRRRLGNPEDLAEAAAEFVKSGRVEHLAVTLGRDGALLASDGEVLRHAALPVTAVSAVGAGDSFIAAMTWAFSEGESARDAFVWGMAAGAAAVLTLGTELSRRADVERLRSEMLAEQS
nr:1-phosphofructokinase family hexose kinase [uncultured Roseococcus sp.]